MATVNLQVNGSAYVKSTSPSTHFPTNTSTWYAIGYTSSAELLFRFNALPSNLRHNKITSYRLRIQARMSSSTSRYAYAFGSAFDPNTVTYNTKPSKAEVGSNPLYYYSGDEATGDVWLSMQQYSVISDAVYMMKYGCGINGVGGGENSVKTVLSGGGNPYLEITYDESVKATSKVIYKSGAKSGYLNPRNASTFQWALEKAESNINCYDDNFSQSSATFCWKASTDSNYTAVSISGDTKTVTIPANTFPTASTIQWYVSATDEENTTTQTEVFSFSTSAGTATAHCVAPVDSVEDGSAPITFRWSLSSTDGQTPSKIRSAWRKTSDPDEQEYWHELFETTTIGNTFIAPDGTFPAGGIRWNIRVWNIDGVEGNRDYAEFISVAAPDAPEGLGATEVPYTTISWQSAEQQAYEISIDGQIVKRAFGTDVYSWKVSEPLSEGNHVISVRVQGQYGFWSQPSEITITVAGARSQGVITGQFGVDAVLTHSYHQNKKIMWYRDGVLIGTSFGSSESGAVFVDRNVLGEHSYFARYMWNNEEDYDQSNTIFGAMDTCKTLIAPYDGSSDWIELKLSENSANEEGFSWSKINTTQRVKGAVYPMLETSDFESLSATYNCSFPDLESMKRFEALKGKVVILKSRGDNVVVGMLSQMSKRAKNFFVTYSFTIQQIHVKDFSEQ